MSVICFLLLLTPLASCSTPTTPDPLQLTKINLEIPTDAAKSPVMGDLDGTTILHVRVTFKVDPKLLDQAQQQKMQPSQPSHLEQFAKQVGIDDGTYQKIKSFFNVQGITLNLSKLRTHLSVDAKASTIAKVFHTKFVVHKYNNLTFYAPDDQKPAQAPTFFVNSVEAITGLDNFSSAPTHDLTMDFHTPAQPKGATADCSPQDQTLFPKDVAHAYGFDQLWNRGWHGENKTINLVEIDGAYKDDVQNYFDCINFQGKFSVVNVDGHPKETLGESTLDIQMVAGLARSSNIKVYQTDASDPNGDIWVNVNDELQKILDDNINSANVGNVVSVSLGAAEGEITGSDMRAIDSSLRQLTQVEHIAVFVASGDCGAFTSRVYGQLAVSFPASDPWSIAVGGTILQIDRNKNRASEYVWSDNTSQSRCQNDWGSGGGNSAVYNRQSWQNAPGVTNQYAKGKRQLPDVSAVAYGLAVYYKGQWGAVGGTSAASPIWATGLALVNQGLAQQVHNFNSSPDVFYKVANKTIGKHPYNDITRGNNLYYPATPGWDYATGLGTPNLADFYQSAYSLM